MFYSIYYVTDKAVNYYKVVFVAMLIWYVTKFQSSDAFLQVCVLLINFHEDLGSMCMIESLQHDKVHGLSKVH